MDYMKEIAYFKEVGPDALLCLLAIVNIIIVGGYMQHKENGKKGKSNILSGQKIRKRKKGKING